MDSRGLRELGLLEVALLYGLDERAAPREAAAPHLQALLTACGRWMIVGEVAGDENPFAGAAGKLLDGMLASVGCRRGGELAPVDRLFESATPKMILVLGESAATQLLGTEGRLANFRGRVHRYRDIAAVVTQHPAGLLQAPRDKSRTWEDLVLARRTAAAG